MPAQLVLAKDLLPGSHTLVVLYPYVTGKDRGLSIRAQLSFMRTTLS